MRHFKGTLSNLFRDTVYIWCATSIVRMLGVRQNERVWCTPASLLMAIQISRVIERSSIWMPSARDVTQNRAITLPFLDASLVPSLCSCRSLSRFASPSVSAPLPRTRWSLLCFYSRWIYDSIGSTLRPRSISARRGARAPNGRTLEGAYHRDRRTGPGSSARAG